MANQDKFDLAKRSIERLAADTSVSIDVLIDQLEQLSDLADEHASALQASIT